MDQQNMSSTKTFCLFNCDQTFPLRVVAELLNAVQDSLPYTFSVEQHPFALSRMRVLSEEVSSLKMDYAIFVVHAHESRLSINEEKAGIGYAVLFKALLRATGNKVLVVIGGDDNYKNRDEEDTLVLSRWAKRKIMSQFTEDFLDGSTSFIFSWEKKHRQIHEEALLHFLLPRNEGIKFQPRPKPTKPEPNVLPTTDVGRDNGRGQTGNEGDKFQPKPRPTKVERTSGASPAETRQKGPFPIDNTRGASDSVERSSLEEKKTRHESSTTPKTPTRPSTAATIPPTTLPLAGQRRHNSSLGVDQHKLSEPEPPVFLEDVIFVGCELKERTRSGVFQFANVVHKNVRPKESNLVFHNSDLKDAVDYVSRKTAKFCVIFVDKKNMDRLEDLPDQRNQYLQLLQKSKENIGEKVVVVLCGDIDHKENDLYSEGGGRKFNEYVAPVLGDKAILFTWNTSYSKIHVESMLQILQPIACQNHCGSFPGAVATGHTADSTARTNTQPNKGRPLPTLERTSVTPLDHPLGQTNRAADDDDFVHLQNSSSYYTDVQDPRYRHQDNRSQAAQSRVRQGYQGLQENQLPYGRIGIVLKTRLRYGQISYHPSDVVYREERFVAPSWLAEHLLQTKRDVRSAVVEISRDPEGELRPKIIVESWIGKVKSYVTDF